MTTYTGPEIVALFLSGGASNPHPSDSLGGMISSVGVLGMYAQVISPVAGLLLGEATPANLEGEASIAISGGNLTYTPPDGSAGAATPVAEGETKFLTGSVAAKGIWVTRVANLGFTGTATFRLLDQMNGVVSMSDVPDADRQAGSVCYRAVFVKRMGSAAKCWFWITTDGQSSFALAKEEPESAGDIQTISDETTAPTGLSWVSAVSEASALEIPQMVLGGSYGIWIRRTFPAVGDVALDEQVNFHLKVEEGE